MRSTLAIVVVTLVSLAGFGQGPASSNKPIGLPIDWSTRHIIHSNLIDDEFAQAAQHEPRMMFSWLQRHSALTMAAARPQTGAQTTAKKSSIKRDWNFTLGSGTVAPNMFPAKFGFDVTAAPSCANDYAIYGLNVAGVTSGAGTAQPNLVGFNNLYTGTGSAVAITAAASSGTTVTITTGAVHGLAVNDVVYIAGVTNGLYDGAYTVTAATALTFQYTSASSGISASSGGTAAKVNGLCTTGVPSVKWAYNISTASGAIVTSPTLSLGGDKVAFVESKLSTATIAASATPGATETSSTVTITTTAAHGFSVNDIVVISGVSPAGFNGTFTIATVPSTTTFTYVANLSGLGTTGGGGTASVAKGGATFSVLTLGTSGDNGSFDFVNNVYHVVTAGGGSPTNNASLLSTSYTSAGNTRSSPYVIYWKDVAFFGDDNGVIYRTSCVFNCSSAPTVTAINTSVGSVKMAPPVVDDYSSKLFVGGSDGKLYTIANPDTCTVPCTITPATTSPGTNNVNGGIFDGVLIDSTFQTVATSAGDSSTGKVRLSQYNEALTLLGNFDLGNPAFPVVNGIYTDEYYNNTIGSPTVNGFAYFCANNNSGQASIYTVTMAGSTSAIAASGATESGNTVTITTTAAHGLTAANIGQQVKISGVAVAGYNGTFTITSASGSTITYTNATSGLAVSGGGTVTKPLTTTNPPVFSSNANSAIAGANRSTCSPYTIFTSGGTERLFFSSPSIPKNSCPTNAPTITDGCLFEVPITTSTGAFGSALTASIHGGTSALIVDNTSASTQAASIYFANEGQAGDAKATTCNYTSSNTASYCAIKLTQSGLQ